MTFPLTLRRTRRARAAAQQTAAVHTAPTRTGCDPCTAEVAECTCPEFCERDHGNE